MAKIFKRIPGYRLEFLVLAKGNWDTLEQFGVYKIYGEAIQRKMS